MPGSTLNAAEKYKKTYSLIVFTAKNAKIFM